MAVSLLHLFSQKSALSALGRVAVRSLVGAGTSESSEPGASSEAAGPWFEERAPAPGEGLVREFIKTSGGDAGWYRGVVPVGMFAQWTFGAVSRALSTLPWPMTRVLNAGVTIVSAGRIPLGESLLVRARIAKVDVGERRAKISTEVETGTSSDPTALRAVLHTYLPFGKPASGPKPRSESAATPERASDTARELAFWSLARTAGRDFALLTGDLNPIHWVGPIAKIAGFRSVILHGFASMARSIEGLNRAVFVGDPSKLASLDVRFLRPLVLPARVGLYLDRATQRFWLADGPTGPAYLSGSFGVTR